MRREIDTGYRPHKFQLEIHHKLKRFSVLVCHRRFGKTYLAVNTLVDAALRCQKEAGRFGYVAPYRNQAKSIAWDYLKKFSMKIPGTKVNEGELYVEYPNGARVRIYGADNADAMRGLYFDGIVLDEIADMKPEVWSEIVNPALRDRKGWCLFIGTPKGINQFHDLYQGALNGFPMPDGTLVKDPQWWAGMYRVDETNLIDEAELEASARIMSENQYRQEWLCDFSASTDNTLITIDMVAAACKRMAREDMLQGMPKILGVDVARFGGDRSVIQRRWGYAALEPIVFNGIDNMELVGRVGTIIAEWKPDAIFIDAGRGEGVIDRLRQLGHSVIEINFGGKPGKPLYANKRSEMWDDMAKWVRDTAALPNHPELKTDLCVPTYSFDAANRMVLESKDKIRERGLRSPDIADALALTFAQHVSPTIARRWTQPARLAQSDYDPLG